jgi:antitoxin Phd
MLINIKQTIAISEANQNFSKATKLADKYGNVVIFKNNKPKYKLVSLEAEPDLQLTDDEKIDIVARRVLERFKPAFRELAK